MAISAVAAATAIMNHAARAGVRSVVNNTGSIR